MDLPKGDPRDSKAIDVQTKSRKKKKKHDSSSSSGSDEEEYAEEEDSGQYIDFDPEPKKYFA